MKKITCLFFLLMAGSILAQNIEIPDSFKHLKRVIVDKKYPEFANAFVNKNTDTTVAHININDRYGYSEITPIAFIQVYPDNPDKLLLTFNPGPSADPNFEFYKVKNDDFVFLFSIGATEIYIPDNGFIYVSGHTNNMFNKRRKFRYVNDSIVEIKQPFYYVGLSTTTEKPIKLYNDKKMTTVIASLPSGAPVEVVAAEFSESAEYFLIKTSFGLLGWWKLDHYYSHTIKGLYYAGD